MLANAEVQTGAAAAMVSLNDRDRLTCADGVAAGNERSNRLMAREHSVTVIERDDTSIHDSARVVHGAICYRGHDGSGWSADVYASMAGCPGLRRWFEVTYDLPPRYRPGPAVTVNTPEAR